MMKLSAILLAAAILLSACGGDSDKPVTAESWADDLCGAIEIYESRVNAAVASTGSSDASTLSFDDRKRRGETLSEAYIEAMQQLTDNLEDIDAPEDAQAYHAALIQQMRDARAELIRAQPISRNATSAAQLDELNTAFGAIQARSSAATEAAGDAMKPETVEALTSVEDCGNLSN